MITATVNQASRLVVITVRGVVSQDTLARMTALAESRNYSVLVRFK